MSTATQVKNLIQKLYGNQDQRVQHLAKNVNIIPSVMGTAPRNQKELNLIKKNGYDPVSSLEADSKRFGSNQVGRSKDAINNAVNDIKDIKQSRTAQTSTNYRKFLKSAKQRLAKNQDLPQKELVLLSNEDDSKVLRQIKPADVEFIYHNTHDSEREIAQRHPKQLFYTHQDAKIDAKRDLQ